MLEQTRRKIAGFFGRIEHTFGIITGFAIAVFIGGVYFDAPKQYVLYVGYATFICWLIYLLSHRLEKKFYGNIGFR